MSAIVFRAFSSCEVLTTADRTCSFLAAETAAERTAGFWLAEITVLWTSGFLATSNRARAALNEDEDVLAPEGAGRLL